MRSFSTESSSTEVVFHSDRLPWRSSSSFSKDSTRVDLQMLESKFSSFPAISLIARFGGGGGGWWEKLKLKLTQPQVELEAWAELGKKRR